MTKLIPIRWPQSAPGDILDALTPAHRRRSMRFGATEPRTVGQHEVSLREFTKSETRQLRALAQEAYARELDTALRDLDSAFSDWRRKRISGFQLSDFIHDFHRDVAQNLYSDYTRLDPGFLVARAIARNLLEPREVPAAVRAVLQDLITYCRERYEDQDGS